VEPAVAVPDLGDGIKRGPGQARSVHFLSGHQKKTDFWEKNRGFENEVEGIYAKA